MLKNACTLVYRRTISLLLILCIMFVSFASPAYASEDTFVDDLRHGAGNLTGAMLTGGAICLTTAALLPAAAPFVCAGATADSIWMWFANQARRFAF
jgi:hypothetical protein